MGRGLRSPRRRQRGAQHAAEGSVRSGHWRSAASPAFDPRGKGRSGLRGEHATGSVCLSNLADFRIRAGETRNEQRVGIVGKRLGTLVGAQLLDQPEVVAVGSKNWVGQPVHAADQQQHMLPAAMWETLTMSCDDWFFPA